MYTYVVVALQIVDEVQQRAVAHPSCCTTHLQQMRSTKDLLPV